MRFLKMFEISAAPADEPKAGNRTWVVLAGSEDEACSLVPADQQILRAKCNDERVRETGESRIIGWRCGSVFKAAGSFPASDHPLAGPHPTD